MALCQETQREERHPSIPSSGVLSSALMFTGGVMEGVAHSPLTEAGRAREGAQRCGTYMSLTSPPLRQFKPDSLSGRGSSGRGFTTSAAVDNFLLLGHRQGGPAH